MKKQIKRFSKRVLSFLIGSLGYGALRLIMLSCTVEVKGLKEFVAVASKNSCILMLWHHSLSLIPYLRSLHASTIHYTAVISNSSDGEILAALVRLSKNASAVRIAHNARHQGLRKVIKELKEKKQVFIIAPDGPRGPSGQMKPGILLAASKAQVPVIAFSWQSERVWLLNTWDRLMIPKPFSHIVITLGSPMKIQVASRANGINPLPANLCRLHD